MKIATQLALLSSVVLSACRTLDPGAETVLVIDRAPDTCNNLGVVNVDWAVWGVSSELLNVMRNQTMSLRGNTLVVTADATGIAYYCPDEGDMLDDEL